MKFFSIKYKLLFAFAVLLAIITLLNTIQTSYVINRRGEEEAFVQLSHQLRLFQKDLQDLREIQIAVALDAARDEKNLSDLAILYNQALKLHKEPGIALDNAFSLNKITSLNRLQLILLSARLSGAALYLEDELSHYVTQDEAGMTVRHGGQDVVISTRQREGGKVQLVNWRNWLEHPLPVIVTRRLPVVDRFTVAFEFPTAHLMILRVIVPIQGVLRESFLETIAEQVSIAAPETLPQSQNAGKAPQVIGMFVFSKTVDMAFLQGIASRTGMFPAIFSADGRQSLQLNDLGPIPAERRSGQNDEVIRTRADHLEGASYYQAFMQWRIEGEPALILGVALSRAGTVATIRQTIISIVSTVVLIFLIVGAVGYLVVTQMIAPIKSLTAAVSGIGLNEAEEPGGVRREMALYLALERYLDRQMTARSNDEIGELTRAFNIMAGQLHELIGNLETQVAQRTQELSEANQQLQEEILEREQIQRELLRARDELELRVQERTLELAASNDALRLDITERKRIEEALKRERTLIANIMETSPIGITTVDVNGQITFANAQAIKILGLTKTEIVQRTYSSPAWHITDFAGNPFPVEELPFVRVITTGQAVHDVQHAIEWPDGRRVLLSINAAPLKDDAGQIEGMVAVISDITERKRAEEVQRRLNRELRALSECNQVLLRAVDEQTLLNNICRIICEVAGYRMAWVGYAEHDDAQTVRPVAWAGVEEGYLANANITWADTERGHSPTGTAIRTGENTCIQNFMTDPQIAPWREKALQRGYRSSLAFPLKDERAATFGALNIYAAEPNAFTADEIRLLGELANDLAFGIVTLRTRDERMRAEEALQESEQRVRRKLDAILSPEADISALELSDIIDSEKIQKLMDEFYRLTNIGIGIIDLHGKVLVGTGWQDICTKFHRMHPESCQLCIESDLELSRNVPSGTFKHYRCKLNMWDIATPIMLGDKHVGNIFLGQFLFDDETPDYETFRQQAHRYGFNEQEYLAALDQVPRWSRNTVNAAMSFYAAFAGLIGNLSYGNIKLANALEERKRAEAALQDQYSTLRSIIDSANALIFSVDRQYRYTSFNTGHATVMHALYGAEIEIGHSLLEYMTVMEDRETAQHNLDRALAGEQLVEEAYSGEELQSRQYFQISHSPIKTETGEVIGVAMLAQDMTERKRAEEAVRQSERRKTVLNQIAHIFLTVPDEEMYVEILTVVLQVLHSPFGIFGYIGETGDLIIPSLTRGIWDACQVSNKSIVFPSETWGDSLWGKAIRMRKAFVFDGPFHTPEGHIPIEHFLTAPIVFGQETIGLISVANKTGGYAEEDKELLEYIVSYIAPILNARLQRDLQERERKQAERDLQRSNDLLRAIIEAAPTAIIGLDLDGNVQAVWNPAAEKMLGWSAREAMGRLLPSVPVESQEEFKRFRDWIRSGQTLDGIEVRRQRRDGSPIDYSIYASPLHDAEGLIIGNVAVLVDITERKRAEAEIKKLSQAVEHSLAAIIITDTAGNIEYVNPKFTQITGYTRDEVLGRNPRILKSGETSPEEYQRLWETIIHGNGWRGEFHNKKKTGELYWESASISPVIGAQGNITHFVAVKEDITARKQMEETLRILNEELELRVSQRTAELEAANKELQEFAHIVSHDLKAPLRGISRLTQWLQEDYAVALGAQGQEQLHLLGDQVKRMDTLIDGILRYSKAVHGSEHEESFDLNALVSQVIDMLMPPPHITIRLENTLPIIHGDSVQLMQVFQNILSNAMKFMDKPLGKITVASEDAGGMWVFRIEDNGPGIEARHHERIFKIFQSCTLRDARESTGIGLAVVKKIVELYGGRVWLESTPGHGSRFSFTWPKRTSGED